MNRRLTLPIKHACGCRRTRAVASAGSLAARGGYKPTCSDHCPTSTAGASKLGASCDSRNNPEQIVARILYTPNDAAAVQVMHDICPEFIQHVCCLQPGSFARDPSCQIGQTQRVLLRAQRWWATVWYIPAFDLPRAEQVLHVGAKWTKARYVCAARCRKRH